MLLASHDEGAVPSSGAVSSLVCRGVIPSASHDEGAMPSLGVALSLGAALRGGAASLDATLCGGAASLGAALSRGRRGTIPSASQDGAAMPSSGVALCKCMMPTLLHNEGAVPSSHDEGGVPLSHGESVVPSLSWGASVSCGSASITPLGLAPMREQA